MLCSMPSKKSSSKRSSRKRAKQFEQSEYQKWLEALVEETGLTHEQFADLSEKLGRRIPASSLRSTLRQTDTLSYKVLEYIALTCGRDPLDVMARGLDNPPPKQKQSFEGTLIEVIWNLHRQLRDEDRAHVERFYLRPLIADMRERIRAQGKD